jgi:hypothetical protein
MVLKGTDRKTPCAPQNPRAGEVGTRGTSKVVLLGSQQRDILTSPGVISFTWTLLI